MDEKTAGGDGLLTRAISQERSMFSTSSLKSNSKSSLKRSVRDWGCDGVDNDLVGFVM